MKANVLDVVMLLFGLAICTPSLSAEELTGIFHNGTGYMVPSHISVDGGGLAKTIEVSGEKIKDIPDGAHIWVEGPIKTSLELAPADPLLAQKPSQWHVVLTCAAKLIMAFFSSGNR